MSQLTLYAHDEYGPNPPKVAILLEALNLSYNVVRLPFGVKGVKSTEFLKINPNGRVPAFVDHSRGDFTVWESGAILYYIAEAYDTEGTFFGRNIQEKAIVMQWLTHQLSGLGPVQGNVNFAYLYWKDTYSEEPPKSVIARFADETNRLFAVLETQLSRQAEAGSSFIALDRFTIADMAFYPWLRISGATKIDLANYPQVKSYRDRIAALPSVQAAYKTLAPVPK